MKRYIYDQKSETKRTSDSSRVNSRYFTHDELKTKLANVQLVKRDAIKRVMTLSIKVSQAIERNGVNSIEHSDLFTEILEKNDVPFQENSPQWLLWEQQKEVQATKKDKRGIRWHPLITRYIADILNI